MDLVDLLGATLGIGFLAGIRLYATVLLLGFVVRFNLFHPPAQFASLEVLGHPWVMTAASIAFVLEFFADKFPWVDSLWDAFHSVIRPLGAILIGATALGQQDPVTRTIFALLCGGVAFTSHSSKAATRLVANHSPEPFSNFGLSIAGDLFVPFALWFTLHHPVIVFGIVNLFIFAFFWYSPPIFRSLRVEYMAAKALLSKVFTQPPEAPPTDCVRCSAGKGVDGLLHSVGNLCLENDAYVFTTTRLYRLRTHRIALADISIKRVKPGFLVDTLTLVVNDYEQKFDVFKAHTEALPDWFLRLFKARAGFPATSSS